MPKPMTLDAAKFEIHETYDAWHNENYTETAALIDDVVTAAQSDNEDALRSARSEFHLQKNAWDNERYTNLSELLDDLVTAAKA
ncbi:hypothetical protein [Streptomyces sp. NPDC058084]|uniref:hypothetical protein n=1 Tax=Streptomyces sp. NPDC058084 TaxID=3346333 RepID=UPI0036EBA52B